MTHTLLVVADLLLALGACLRLTRFVVADDIPGRWWIKAPLTRRAFDHMDREKEAPRWYPYLDGLSCPFCLSVWVALIVLIPLRLAGGPGEAYDWWRWVAGFLTLAWLTGHIAARAGDTEDD